MTPVFPLASSGDYSTVFFEAKYRILHDRFVSKTEGGTVFPPLEVLYDYRGRSILPPGIDRKKFRLLSESRQFDKFYDTVTELYGYTPTKSFTTSVVTAWTRPAYKCELENIVVKALTSWSVGDDGSTAIQCDNSDGRIMVGTLLDLESGEYERQNTQDDSSEICTQTARGISVLEATNSSFKVGAFDWTIYNLAGEQRGTVESDSEDSAFNQDGISIIAKINGDSRSMSLLSSDDKNQIHIVSVDNSDGLLKDGDNVKFVKQFYKYLLQTFFYQESEYVTILKAYADRIIVPFFTWTAFDGDNRYNIDSDDKDSGFFAPGGKSLTLRGSERSSWAADFAGTQVVDYVSEFDPKNAWAPESGREIVDFLAYYTTPTLQEYQEMISRGDMVLAQPQTFELVAGDVYKRTSVYVKCQ